MNIGVVKVLAAYASASIAALVASVKLACILGSQMVTAFSGSFFR